MELTLDGLRIAPAQAWGQVRLVPLIREVPMADLRLAVRDYRGDGVDTVVHQMGRGGAQVNYVPHGLVVRFDPDGRPLAAIRTEVGARRIAAATLVGGLSRMVRREGRHGLRLLPLHLAMEGLIAEHFGGPDVALPCWSHAAVRGGLHPRREGSVAGASLSGLSEALRVFEIHPGQCGVLLFIADALASATIVSHPEDYGALHRALIGDFYGSTLYHWGWIHRDVADHRVVLDADRVDGIGGLRRELERQRQRWADHTAGLAQGLFSRRVDERTLRKAGSYRLVRFCTGLDTDRTGRGGEHLGEALVAEDGRLAYLKTYRLDRAAARRGHVLSQLAAAGWDPQAAADAQGHGEVRRVVQDLDLAGLGHLVRDHWRHHGPQR